MYKVCKKVVGVFKKTIFVTDSLIEAIDYCQKNRDCQIVAGKQVVKYEEFGWVS